MAHVRPYDPDPRTPLDRGIYPEHRMTTRIVRPALALTTLLILAGLTWTGASAVARMSAAAPPTNPILATVDLEAIVAQINERKDKEDALKASLAEAQKNVDTIVEGVKAEQSKIEQLSGAQKDAAVKRLREMAIRAEFEKQYAQKLLIEMQGEMLRDLYLKISDTTKRHAKKNGYAMVLVTDEKLEIPKSDPEAITRAISSKRMMYVDPSLDITADIVTQMNNEYSAARK